MFNRFGLYDEAFCYKRRIMREMGLKTESETKVSPRHVHDSKKTELSKKSILIVDDSQELVDLCKEILEMNGYQVYTASSGQEALAVLDVIDKPDLILLDMMMDDLTGPEFLKTLESKRIDIVQDVPVVFLTGMDEVPLDKAVGYIRKPFEIYSFLSSVNRFIEGGTDHPAQRFYH